MVFKKLFKKIIGKPKKSSSPTSETTSSTQAETTDTAPPTFARQSSDIEEEKTEIEEPKSERDRSGYQIDSNIESLSSRSQQEMLDEQLAKKLQEEEDSISASSFTQKYKQSKPKKEHKPRHNQDSEHAAQIIAEREQRNNDMFDMYMQYYYR